MVMETTGPGISSCRLWPYQPPKQEGRLMGLFNLRYHQRFLLACAALVGLSNVARTATMPSAEMVGKTIDHVVLKDASGKTLALDDFTDRKAMVVVFLSFECPVSTSYAQPLANLSRE